MATVTKFKSVGERVGNGIVKTGESVARGTIAMYSASGYIEEVEDTVDCVFAGIVKAAASADEKCEFDYGSPFFYADAAAAQSDVGEMAYVSGAGTIGKSGANNIEVGLITDVSVGVGWWIDPVYPRLINKFTPQKAWGQATTGTGGSVGEVAAIGVTAGAVIIAIGAEAASDVAYVVAGVDKFTVYDAADAALDTKKVNYLIMSY